MRQSPGVAWHSCGSTALQKHRARGAPCILRALPPPYAHFFAAELQQSVPRSSEDACVRVAQSAHGGTARVCRNLVLPQRGHSRSFFRLNHFAMQQSQML